MLLVLDNAEHLVDVVADLCDALLRRCPDVAVLTTSREPLGIPGEVVWRVPCLGVPAPDSSLEVLARSDAVTLFCERAWAADASFALTPENGGAVARICRRLDGIPLAIELAAARVRVLGPDRIADRLDDRFRFLSSGPRTAAARQQTLRATMDWSYELLPPPERLLLERLGVFAGTFDLDACEAVAADEALPAGEVLDLLAHLVDKSLVVASGSGGDVGYRLLETVHQYAEEKLSQSGSSDEARRRHRDYFVQLTDQIFSFPESTVPWADWVTRTKVEDDLWAAVEWSLAQDDVDAALSLVVPLGYYWALAGRLGEGRARLERVLDLCRPSYSAAWGRAVNVLGLMFSMQGDIRGSLDLHIQALGLARQMGHPYDTVIAGWCVGTGLLHAGRIDDAEPLLVETHERCQAVGSPAAKAWCEMALGWVRLARGDLARATEHFELAVSLGRRGMAEPAPVAARPEGGAAALEVSPLILAHSLASLAPLIASGDRERASVLAAEAVSLARRFRLFAAMLMALTRAAEVGILLGDWASARAAMRESLTLLRDTGAHAYLADTLEMAAALRTAAGASEAAARLFGASDGIREATGESPDVRSISDELERCRAAASNDPHFEEERARGARMPAADAVAYALGELERVPEMPHPHRPPDLRRPAAIPAMLRRHETGWQVRYGSVAFELPDMKGLGYLAQLLARPGTEVHVLNLRGGSAAPDSVGPVLDERAKREYRRRVSELEDEIAEARSWNDRERAERAEAELGALAQQLAAAVGLGGRDRPVGSTPERARVSVRKAIATAIARIADHNADLGLLLSTTVRTGSYCGYTPDPRLPVDWSIEAAIETDGTMFPAGFTPSG